MKMRLVPCVLFCFLAVLLGACSGYGTHPKQVVFVCEHGAGRSVVAAAWFNKLAGEKQLPYRAVARGVTPQDELSKPTVAGLKRMA
jgi:arsenate reductase